MFFYFECSSVLGLDDERESPNLLPNSDTTMEGEIDLLGVVRVINSLVKVDISVVVVENLGFASPGKLVDALVISGSVMEINLDGGIIGGLLIRRGVEGEDGTKNGVRFAEGVSQFNGEASLRGTGNGLDSEVLIDVSGHMRVTFDQTKSSVLSLGGIPVGLSESL